MQQPLTDQAQTDDAQTEGVYASRALFYLGLAIVGLAFVRILPNSDPMSGGFTAGRLWEAGLVVLGFGIVPLVLLMRGHALSLRLSEQAPIIAFFIWAMLSSAWSYAPGLSMSKSIELGFMIFGAALFAASFSYIRKSRYDFVNMFTVAMTSLVFVGLLANTMIWGWPLALRGVDGIDPRPRLLFAYSHPIEYADVASFALIGWFASSFSWRWKAVFIPFLLYIHHLTDARSSMAAVILTIVLMFLFHRGRNMRLAAGFTAWSVVLTYLIIMTNGPHPDRIWAPIQSLLPSDFSSLNGRTGLWEIAMNRFHESPITGVGFYASRYALMPSFSWAGDTHNAWIESLLTTGIIGFTLLIISIVVAFSVAIRTSNKLLFGVLIYVLLCTYTAAPLIAPKLPTLMILLCLNEAICLLPRPVTYRATNPSGSRLPGSPMIRSANGFGALEGAGLLRVQQQDR